MKPYWRDEAHALEIYHGDCLEVMPELEGEFELCLTDPPYGVDYTGGTKVRDGLNGDSTSDIAISALPLIYVVTSPSAATYLWNSDTAWLALLLALEHTGFVRRATIVWDKMLAQYGALSAQYKQQHEYCFYLYKQGHAPAWYGPTNEVTVWRVRRQSRNELHPTQKPVALMMRPIRNSSTRGDSVLDCFLGSGTTLVACYRLGRRGVGIEISEEYCELAARRLEQEIAQGRLWEPGELEKPKQETLSLD